MALDALFRYAAERLSVEVLRADIDPPNDNSIRLFSRLGFVQVSETIYTRTVSAAMEPLRPQVQC